MTPKPPAREEPVKFFQDVTCTCSLCGKKGVKLGQIAQGFASGPGYEFCNCPLRICTECVTDGRGRMQAHLNEKHRLP